MADYLQLQSGVIVPLAEFAEQARQRPDTTEIATIDRDITRAMMFGGILENLDDTLRTRGRVKGLKIYDELERDCHAFAVLQKRKLAVTTRDWQVNAASDSPLDQRAADVVQAQLERISFDKLTTNLLDATLKGYAVGEIMWEVDGAEIRAARVVPREQRRFVFDKEMKLRLLTPESLSAGELMPERKFIVHSVGAKDGSPYGLGLGHKLFWPVFFKRQDISFWLVFADKFGSPTAIGKYPPGAQKADQDKLLSALKAISQDAGIIVPDGMLVELLEAARSGSIDTYEKLARYMDEQMSVCVLGETISTTAKSTGLGSGVADTQNDVRVEIAKADADMLSDTLNESLVRWIVDYNVPGAGYPTVYRQFEEEEDVDKRSQVDQRLHEMGYEPESIEQINQTYGGNWRKMAARPPSLGLFGASRPSAQFAEPSAAVTAVEDQEALEQAASHFSERWRELIGPRVDELIAMAEETGDLVTFRERLGELLRTDPVPELVDTLERSSFAAHLLGRTLADRG